MEKGSSVEEMLAFFRLDERALKSLERLQPILSCCADEFVQEFYRHLLQFPEPQQFLKHTDVRERLLASQREYLLSLAEPVIDDDYVRRRSLIGATHERIGLDTKWYLGAYALYFSLLTPRIQRELDVDGVELEATISALAARLLFDSELAIRQYIERREFDLRELNRELTKSGQALTKEVDQTHRDLRRIEARASAAERLASVATLVTGLAHEIGTPMGVVRGHAEALEGHVESERAKWRLGIILEQIDRITGIIQSLLNIARPKESLRVEVDLAQVCESCVAFLAEKTRRRGVEIVRDFSPHPFLKGDPEKMQQVFLNLLINALDAMQSGGELRLSVGDDGDGGVVARVSDSGPGIPDDQLARIFDPFYTTKEAGHGNGLGLVVVKGIVEEHGGEIRVQNRSEGGAEFEIHLPAALPAG